MMDGKTPCVIDFSKPFRQISIIAALEEALREKLPSPFTDDGTFDPSIGAFSH